MGRPRKSAASKSLRGTRRPDREHGREIGLPPGSPAKPADLSPRASVFWELVVPQLVSAGIATAIDAPALADMCEARATLEEIRTTLKGLAITSTDYYRTLMSSQVAQKTYHSLASKFGLTPADRQRIHIDTPKGPQAVRRPGEKYRK
jgi:P27 family predicted phage terminase small subunit